MIQFKSPEDLQKLSAHDPAYPVVKKLVDVLINAYTWEGHPYLPDDYGYVVLIEEKDVDRVLDEIWDYWTLLDIPWEGINHVTPDFFYAVFLAKVNKLMASITAKKTTKKAPLRKTAKKAPARKTSKKALIKKKASVSRRK